MLADCYSLVVLVTDRWLLIANFFYSHINMQTDSRYFDEKFLNDFNKPRSEEKKTTKFQKSSGNQRKKNLVFL